MYENIRISDCCSKNELNYEYYYGLPIVTPRKSISFQVRSMTETYIRSKISPGRYENSEIINTLIKDVFTFLEGQIDALIRRLSSKEIIFILLVEYSISSKIQERSTYDIFRVDLVRWKERRTFRRSVKYLAEKMLENFDDSRIVRSSNFAIEIELLIELTEIAFDFSVQSALVYGIGRENGCFELYNPLSTPSYHYYDFYLKNFEYEVFENSHRLYRTFIEKYGPLYNNIIAEFEEVAAKVLNDRCCSFFNFFIKIFDILRSISAQRKYIYLSKSDLKNRIIENDIPADCVDLFFDAFPINRAGIRKQPRKIYATKQSYRLKIRFMIEIEENGTLYLFYTGAMLREGYILFRDSLCYNDLPIELQSSKLKKECAKMSLSYGKKFEQYANKFLATKGFYGLNCKRKIPSNQPIPNDVGEIDFLGYSKDLKRLVCFEFKNVFYSTDPLEYRDDLDKFIYKKGSYSDKFRRKIEFVKVHMKELADFFHQNESVELLENQLIVGMLTYSPNISRFFIKDFKCMSLAEFEVEWAKDPEQFFVDVPSNC